MCTVVVALVMDLEDAKCCRPPDRENHCMIGTTMLFVVLLHANGNGFVVPDVNYCTAWQSSGWGGFCSVSLLFVHSALAAGSECGHLHRMHNFSTVVSCRGEK